VTRFAIDSIASALSSGHAVVRRVADHAGESDRTLERLIKTGESFHDPLTKLAFRRVMRGDRVEDVVWELQALMRKSQERDTQRWRDRYERIGRTVQEVVEKFPEARVKQALRREGKGFVPDEENVGRILERDDLLQGLVRYDEFMCQRVVTRAIPGDPRVVADREYPRPWRDEDSVALQRYVQDRYIVKIARDRVDAVVGQWSRSLWSFHPIRDYLVGLTWDRRSRVDGWLHLYMGANGAPHDYVRAIGAKWLIAAVARVMQPGCKVDTMLCLEGPQGTRKSMALRALAGAEHFSDSIPADLSSKDARDHLRGKWIVEMSELAQFRKSEIETVKAFLSRQVEMYRPAYGRSEVTYPRQCVFAGSTNASEYLVDDTGNRRFWVVACKDIDLEALERGRDQLWAEAYARWWAGEKWWLEGKIERVAAEQADARRLFDPWQDEIEAMLTTGNMKDLDRVKPSDVLANLSLAAGQQTPFYAARVGKILRALGWRKASRASREYARPTSR
jgi:predicted P-loop ATPase